MEITLNGLIERLPKDKMTVKDLLDWKNTTVKGIAVSVNGRLVPKAEWSVTPLQTMDDVILFIGAFGG